MHSIDREFFQSFIEKLPSGIAIIDEHYRYVIINEALAAFHRVSVDEIVGKSLFDVIPEMANNVKKYIDDVLHHERDNLNIRISGKMPLSDTERHWNVDYKLLILPSGSKSVIVSADEVTELIKQEQRLENSKEYLRRVLDNLFAFVGVLTPDGTLTDANKAPLQAAGIEFEDVVNKKFWDCYWWSYDRQIQEELQQALKRAAAGDTVRYDVDIRVAEGKTLPIDFMLAPLFDSVGNVINLIPSAIDISERKVAEQLLLEKNKQLSILLDEKTTLLNEVHHRVKNNLQVISSLLNLQGQFVDSATAEQFRMCQQRVRAMALVHQLLYESENLASVDLKAYISKLVGLLSEGLSLDNSSWRVRYAFPESDSYLEIRKMIPLAFIITELVTNCLKHGVIKGKGRLVDIMLRDENDNLVIAVADDGPGFSEETFFSSPSLGNRLVAMFAKQIGASISVSAQRPTTIYITFPKALA